MGRPAGQIDEKKRDAILAAASQLFLEKGLKASMAEIARRAGVSKQTLYNRFPTRLDIARALSAQRSAEVTEPLNSNGSPEAVLSAIATTLLIKARCPDRGRALRGIALLSPEVPDLARTIYDNGPAASVRRIADWLAQQDRAGHLSVPDPLAAAEMFSGMVLGHSHLRHVLGLDQDPAQTGDPEAIAHQARETARRFLRAYAVG